MGRKKDKPQKGKKKTNLKGSVTVAIRKIFEKNEVEELIHAQCDCFYLYSGAVKSKLMRSLFKAMEK